MSSPRLTEESNGKGGREEWNPADTHVCFFFLLFKSVSYKNPQLLKKRNKKKSNAHLFSKYY